MQVFKKKKKKIPTPKEILCTWEPRFQKDAFLDLIPYNYRATDGGFEKIKGIAVITETQILCYEQGALVRTLSLQEADGCSLFDGGSFIRIVLHCGEDRLLVATGDLKYKERYGAFVQAINRMLEEGAYLPPAALREKVCPRCGRPYRPGSNTCVRCGSKKKQFLWLFGIIKPLIPGLLLSLLLFFSISAISLISPLLSEKMVDGYLKNESAGKNEVLPYLLVVLAMFGCTVLSRLLSAIRSMVSSKIGSKAAYHLRAIVFEKIQNLSLAGINRRTAGELMQRVTDDTTVLKNFLTGDFGHIVEQITTFVAIGIILIVFDLQNHTPLFLLIFLPAIPALICFRLFHRRIHRIYRTQWMVTSKASTLLHDIFSGIRVVKAFGREEDEIVKYEKSIGAVKQVQKRNELFWAVFSPMLNTLMTMGEFFVLFFVGNAILKGDMTLGEMTKFTSYASMIYGPLRSMAFIPRRIMRATTSLSKIYDLMVDDDILTHKEDAPDLELKGHLTFENVSFGYEAGKPVLKHVDLEVHPGEMIGIVGRSGVGKSTLINLVMRLYDTEDGRVLLDGMDIRDLSPETLRCSVGAVLQETFLFAGTIRDNIAYAKPDATGEEIIAAAKIAGAHEFILRQKDGYDTYVGEKGCTLSGGERQRIAIARAVLLDPKILILDEATSALDTETEKQIQDALQKLIAGRTTLAIAHRLSTLRNATRLIVLDNHGIAEEGTHEELMQNKNGIYYGLVMAQRQMSSAKSTKQ